jgi:LysR family transcriptional regulator, transcription activator of glutamate synthase operon
MQKRCNHADVNDSSDGMPSGASLPSPAERVEALLGCLAPGLEQLAALGDDANVTRAAERSGVSQPTLSRAMARWEREAGTALFRRSGREITLTPQGRLVADAASAALARLRPAAVAAVGDASPSALRIGFLHSLGPNVVGELVSSFLAAQPDVLVSHREGAGSALLDDLRSEDLDVAVIAPRPNPAYGWLPIGTQSLSLVVPAHHRFAALDAIDLATATEESYLSLDRRFATRSLADALCAEAGFAPRILLEADDPQTVRDYVAGGLGVAILPSDTSVSPRVVAVPILSPLAVREVGIAWDARHRLSPLATALREHARSLGTRYPGWADLLDH